MEWISVEDRLPPHDGTHFLGYSEKSEDAVIYVLIYDPGTQYEGEFSRCSRSSSYREAGGECYFTWEISHWMPLPLPPKQS